MKGAPYYVHWMTTRSNEVVATSGRTHLITFGDSSINQSVTML